MTMDRKIGRYQVLEHVASGGQATVFQAFDPESGRIVALKVLHEHLAANGAYLTRFLREASLAKEIAHPNIVEIFEVGRSEGAQFIAMEYLPRSLGDLMQSQPKMPVDRVVDIGRQMAGALEAARTGGVVHRDIKPPNVLIGPNAEVKLTDFGISRLQEDSALTRTGAVMGTPHYMSPEQATGDAVDTRSDIYSLGIVMYQMLAGEVPFDAETPYEVIRKQINDRPVPLRRHRSNVPAALQRIVNRCLAKDPARRYQTPKLLDEALGKAFPNSTPASMAAPKPSAADSDRTTTIEVAAASPSSRNFKRLITDGVRDRLEDLTRKQALIASVIAGLIIIAVLGGTVLRDQLTGLISGQDDSNTPSSLNGPGNGSADASNGQGSGSPNGGDAQLAALANGPTGGLIAYWPADGTADDTVGDNEGILLNGAVYGTGRFGSAFDLDGINDYIELSEQPEIPDEFTVSAWIRIDAASYANHNSIFSSSEFSLIINATSQANAVELATNTGAVVGGVVPSGQWIHVAGHRTTSELRLYVNGVAVATDSLGLDSVQVDLLPQIGRGEPQGAELHPFGGLIDEVRIYDRALSDAEVAELFALRSGLVGSSSFASGVFGDVLYAEDFEESDIGDSLGWVSNGARATVVEGSGDDTRHAEILGDATDGFAWFGVGGTDWSDYLIQFRVKARREDESSEFHVFPRFLPSFNGDCDPYTLIVGPRGPGPGVQIERGDPGTFAGVCNTTTLGSNGTFRLQQEQWHLVEVLALGGMFGVRIDGQEVATVRDPDPNFLNGGMELSFGPGPQGEMLVDDIVVFDLSDAPQPPDGFIYGWPLFADDFESGISHGWTRFDLDQQGSGSIVEVPDSTLGMVLNSQGFAQCDNDVIDCSSGVALAGDSTWTDYVVEFDAMAAGNLEIDMAVRNGVFGCRVVFEIGSDGVGLERRGPGLCASGQRNVANASLSISAGIWNSYRIEVAGQTLTFYVNGQQILSTTSLLMSPNGSIGFSPVHPAFIDNFRVTELVPLVNQVSTGSDLIAHWRADGNAHDSAGQHDGTVHGGVQFGAGLLDDAFVFDGDDDYVEVSASNAPALNPNSFTISAWVNFAGVNGRSPIIANDGGAGDFPKWIFWYDDDGHGVRGPALRFHTNMNGHSTDTITADWTPVTRTWYHVAVTKNGPDYKLFIDGQNVATSFSIAAFPVQNSPLRIGAADDGLYFFDGSIDDIRVYDTAISERAVRTLHQLGESDSDSIFNIPASGDVTFNGHQYVLVENLNGGWDEALAHARSLGGYLVSINSAVENAFIAALVRARTGSDVGIGLTDRNVEQEFTWDSGEPVVYTNWASGEPDNSQGKIRIEEDYVVMVGTDTSPSVIEGQWHDSDRLISPYVVEIEPGYNIPATGDVTFNGHEYRLIEDFDGDWDEAVALAESIGGYIVSINSAEENAFVAALARARNQTDIGIGLDGRNSNRYQWESGEPVIYENWIPGEPDGPAAAPFGLMVGFNSGLIGEEGQWHDTHELFVPFVVEIDPSASGSTSFNLSRGLIAHWGADGNAADSTGSHNGSPTVTAQYAQGVRGNAFDFRNRGAYIEVNQNSDDFNNADSSPVTFSFWAKRTTPSPNGHLFGKRPGCTEPSHYYQAPIVGSQWDFGSEGNGISGNVQTDFPLNTWSFITIVFDGRRYWRFIDGESVALPEPGVFEVSNDAPFVIGGSGTCENFEGLMDEFRVYDRALNSEEIRALYDLDAATAALTIGAPSGFEYGTVLFQDDFDENRAAWSLIDTANNAAITTENGNGVLRIQGGGTGALVRGPNWSDYVLQFRAKTATSGDGFSLVLGPSGPSCVEDLPYHFRLHTVPSQSTLETQGGAPGCASTVVANSGSNGLTRDQLHLFEIVVAGASRSLYVDGDLWMEFTDLEPGPVTGFRVDSGPLTLFDDFLVVELVPTAEVNLSDGLIAYWAAEGNVDDETGSYDGVALGPVNYVPGIRGNAFEFNAVDSYIEITNSNVDFNIAPLQPVTFSLWAKRRGEYSVPNSHALISKKNGCGPADVHYQLNYGSGNNDWAWGSDLGVSLSQGIPVFDLLPDDQWRHIVVTFESGLLRVSVDGDSYILRNRGSFAGPNDGAFQIGASGGCDIFDGLIDEVRVYDRALSPAEIAALYSQDAMASLVAGYDLANGLITNRRSEDYPDDEVGSPGGVEPGTVQYSQEISGNAFDPTTPGTHIDVQNNSQSFNFDDAEPVRSSCGQSACFLQGRSRMMSGCIYSERRSLASIQATTRPLCPAGRLTCRRVH